MGVARTGGRSLNSFRKFACAIALLAVVIAVAIWSRTMQVPAQPATHGAVPTLREIQSLSYLVTARIEVSDVQEVHLNGFTGGMNAVILVRGDVLAGVDLSQARFESVDDSTRTAVLDLPQPRATDPRLDHRRTRIFALKESGLWLMVPGGGGTSAQVIDRGYEEAQRSLAVACEEPQLLARARGQAESVLSTLLKAEGWSLTFRWKP
jgi:hypothetical protein